MNLNLKIHNKPTLAACIAGVLGVYFSDSGMSYMKVLAFMTVAAGMLEVNELYTLAYNSQFAFVLLFCCLVLYHCSHALLVKSYATNLLIMKAPGLVSACFTLALYLQSYTRHYKYLSVPQKLSRDLALQLFASITWFTSIAAVSFYNLPPALIPIGIYIAAASAFWFLIQPLSNSNEYIDDLLSYIAWMFLVLCLSAPILLNVFYDLVSGFAILLELVIFVSIALFGSMFVESWSKKFYGRPNLTASDMSNKLSIAILSLLLVFIFFYLVNGERRDNLFIKQPPLMTFVLIMIYSVASFVGTVKQKHSTSKLVCFAIGFVAISTITDSKEINVSTMLLYTCLSYLFNGTDCLYEIVTLASVLIFSTDTTIGQYWFFRLSIAAVTTALLSYSIIASNPDEIDSYAGYKISFSYLLLMMCYVLSIPSFVQKVDVFNCYLSGFVSCFLLVRHAVSINSLPIFFEDMLYAVSISLLPMTVSNSFTGKLFIFFCGAFLGLAPYLLKLSQKSQKIFVISYIVSLLISFVTIFTKLWTCVASVILALYYPQVSFDDEMNWLHTSDSITTSARVWVFKIYLAFTLFGFFLSALEYFSQKNIFPVITIVVLSLYGMLSNLPAAVTFTNNFIGESLLLATSTLSVLLLLIPFLGVSLSILSLAGKISYSHTLDYFIGSIPSKVFSYLLEPMSGKMSSTYSTAVFVFLVLFIIAIGYIFSTFSFLYSVLLSVYYCQYFILGIEVIYPELLYALTLVLPMTGYSPFILIPASICLHVSKRSYISAFLVTQLSILLLLPWRALAGISYSFGTIIEDSVKLGPCIYFLVTLIPSYLLFYFKRRYALIYSLILALFAITYNQLIIATALASVAVAAVFSSQKLDQFE